MSMLALTFPVFPILFLSLPFAPIAPLNLLRITMPLFRTSFISSRLAYELIESSNHHIILKWRAFQLWICSSLSIRGTISKSADSSLHPTFGSSVQSTLSLSVQTFFKNNGAVNAFLSLSDFMYCSTLKQSRWRLNRRIVNDVGLVLLSLLWFNDAVLYPVPNSINHSFSVGSLLLYCLSIQLISGTLLAFYYIPNIELAFSSID